MGHRDTWGHGRLRCGLAPSSLGRSPCSLASVSPDDHVRIKLKAESNPSRSDFINASPIVSDPWGLLPCHPTP